VNQMKKKERKCLSNGIDIELKSECEQTQFPENYM